jgi:hypothetical protein
MPSANIRIYASLADVLKVSIGASFSSSLRAEESLLSNRNNNELFIINLANGYGQTGILTSGLRKCVAVVRNKFTQC